MLILAAWRRRALSVALAAAILLSTGPDATAAGDFEADLKRIDHALKANPGHVPEQALISCQSRRNAAVRLFYSGQPERAERSLNFCFGILRISATPPARPAEAKTAPVSMEKIQAQAAAEVEQALHLTPNVGNGLEIYRTCAMCHMPEGWGLSNGSVPQIAGQHHKVVIKQLADIRAGNRVNVLMLPYASVESVGGAQAVADVAGYIDTLEISVDTGKGSGEDLELGAKVYTENCARCHGAKGEGNDDTFVPRIQSQHYKYLLQQFELIRDGKRRNANAEMVTQIQGMEERETLAVLDFVSRLTPPEELQAPPGWHNPDFAK